MHLSRCCVHIQLVSHTMWRAEQIQHINGSVAQRILSVRASFFACRCLCISVLRSLACYISEKFVLFHDSRCHCALCNLIPIHMHKNFVLYLAVDFIEYGSLTFLIKMSLKKHGIFKTRSRKQKSPKDISIKSRKPLALPLDTLSKAISVQTFRNSGL